MKNVFGFGGPLAAPFILERIDLQMLKNETCASQKRNAPDRIQTLYLSLPVLYGFHLPNQLI